MSYKGYVPLQRGLLEHMVNARINNTETLVFVTILMLCSNETGSAIINASEISKYTHISHDRSNRALHSLQCKNYIYRDLKTVFGPCQMYRVWVNKFRISLGEHKTRNLNLSEVFETKDTSKIKYDDPATPVRNQCVTSDNKCNGINEIQPLILRDLETHTNTTPSATPEPIGDVERGNQKTISTEYIEGHEVTGTLARLERGTGSALLEQIGELVNE